MTSRLAGWCASHPAVVLGAAMGLLMAGVWARCQLSEDAIPELSDPRVSLVAEWPGHPALELASVTETLTAALADVGASAIRGSSMSGLGYVEVVFARARDLGARRAAVAQRVARAALPAGVRVKVGPEASSTGWIFQYALVSPAARETMHGDGSAGPSLLTLRRLQEDLLRPALSAIPGVAEVGTVGGEVEELAVALRPEALRAAGLAVSDVASTLQAALQLEPALDPAALEALPIASPGPGRRIGDVARAQAVRAMAEGSAELDGRSPVVGGIVIARRVANPSAIIALVRATLDEVRARLPAGVQLVVVQDRSELSRRVGRTLLRALGEEAAVVVLVVLGFLLHGRSALVPLGTLAVVVAATFLGMWLAGIPATVMSLGGIAIAIGLSVDAELVALEAGHRQLEGGAISEGERQARLREATRALSPAVGTALVIAALSFLPALAFPGETGRLLRPLVATKTLVIGAAALAALTVGPALRARLVRGRIVPELDHHVTRLLVRVYRPIVSFALERPGFTLVTAALATISCVPLVGALGGEFLPPISEGDLLFMPTTSPDVPEDLAAAELERQDRALAAHPAVAQVFGKVGRADSATDPAPCSMAETIVRLRPGERLQADALVPSLDAAAHRPGWTSAWTAPVRARADMMSTSIPTAVGIRVVASDPARRDELAEALRGVALALPGTRSAARDSVGAETRLTFAFDEAALALHHVDAAAARGGADLVLTGGRLGRVTRGGRHLSVRLIADLTPRPPEELLQEATVRAVSGQPVPLALLGRAAYVRVPAVVRSERGERVSYVYIDVAEGTDLDGYVERGRRAIAAALASGQLRLLPGERIEWAGEHELLAAGRRRFALIGAVVLLSMLGLLLWQLRSLAEALLVLCAVPFALVGSIWTLFLLDYRLSAPVWVGLLSVVGLAMQTGLVMVVYIDEAFFRRLREGRVASRADIVAAHAEGTVRRLRPKLMTVVTMGAALLPLLWAEGAGAEIMRRVAAPMLGGLVSSTFLTLEVIPVLYTLWRAHQLRVAQRSGRRLLEIIGSGPGWA